MAKKKLASPNWEHWSRIRETTLANAILLSQNICPENHILGGLPQDFGKITNNNIHEILQTALNWLPSEETKWTIDKGPFSPREMNLITVDLTIFSSWLANLMPTYVTSNEFLKLPSKGSIQLKKRQNQKWSEKEIKELKAYKERHGTKLTAQNYEISEGRVRQLINENDKPVTLSNWLKIK
jgi:hypothetical protein